LINNLDEGWDHYNGCGVNNIDLQYWSVGSHICLDQTDRFLPFWTVNAQMMHDLGQEGITLMETHTSAANLAAMKLFDKLGFEVAEYGTLFRRP
jgi:hypothetical protein